jgi:flagellar basal-body rod modification protein FlgD
MDALSALSAAQPKSSATGFSQLTENFDTFITLLTTQLRNQDPLDPLDTEKFTSQLVQFSGVEQAIKTNAHLEALLALQSSGSLSDGAALVGKTVTIADDRAFVEGAGATWRIAAPANAVAIAVAVRDAAGAVVAQKTLSGAADTFIWDGKRDDGGDAQAGVYRLSAVALDGEGRQQAASVSSDHRALAVRFSSTGADVETALGLTPLSGVARVAAN